MINLEINTSYRAVAKNHSIEPDGAISQSTYVPVVEYPERYVAIRYRNGDNKGFIDIYRDNGRIVNNGKLLNWYIQLDETTPTLPKGYEQQCDCGGYKTYNSWAREVHSTWCKVNT